jgi:hypothetical protein
MNAFRLGEIGIFFLNIMKIVEIAKGWVGGFSIAEKYY